MDLIVRTSPAAYAVRFADLRTEMHGALRRLS